MNIQIKTTGFDLTDALKEHTNQRIGSMDKLFTKMESTKEGKHDSVEVFVELSKTHGGQKKGDDIFQTEIQFHLPNTERIVVRSNSWDIHQSIDRATNDIKDRIIRYKGKKESRIRRIRNAKLENKDLNITNNEDKN